MESSADGSLHESNHGIALTLMNQTVSIQIQDSHREWLTMASTKKAERPPFDELPLDKDGPPGNAWGLYGPNDELGALNMLTPETVVAAAQEIKTGERVSLDWHLNKPSRPSFDRPPFEVKLRNNAGRAINDDELHFNTQCSTQWDGFRHFGKLRERGMRGHVKNS